MNDVTRATKTKKTKTKKHKQNKTTKYGIVTFLLTICFCWPEYILEQWKSWRNWNSKCCGMVFLKWKHKKKTKQSKTNHKKHLLFILNALNILFKPWHSRFGVWKCGPVLSGPWFRYVKHVYLCLRSRVRISWRNKSHLNLTAGVPVTGRQCQGFMVCRWQARDQVASQPAVGLINLLSLKMTAAAG